MLSTVKTSLLARIALRAGGRPTYQRLKYCKHFEFSAAACRTPISVLNSDKRLFQPSQHCQTCRLFSEWTSISRGKLNVTPLYLKAHDYPERTALVDHYGSYTYADLLYSANNLVDRILKTSGVSSMDIDGARVSFLCPNNVSYVVTQWAVWMSGGVAVPLSPSHPEGELEYFVNDSGSSLIITTEDFAERLENVSKRLAVPMLVLKMEDFLTKQDEFDMEEVGSFEIEQRHQRNNRHLQLLSENRYKQQGALIIYTSGTTGRPKGVLHTHGSISIQMAGMVQAWAWSANDVILHVLPLHHIHGIVNVLMTPMSIGATCVMLPKFDADQVWSRLLDRTSSDQCGQINLFMAVPTIYSRLIDRYEQRFNRGRGTKAAKDYIKAACTNKIRLMVSGSAALPGPIMTRWEQITGHRLLERYGMTEIGMALTNPLKGNRVQGAVGTPFPGVKVCIAKANVYDPNGYDVIATGNHRTTKVTPGLEQESGELYIRGPHLFKEYWGRPEATTETFTKDGWFKTGDTASYSNGVYRILGRTSVDIIKSGGYKLSALEIERHLLAHPDISDVAIVGLPDVTWGQRVAAIIVLQASAAPMTVDDLRKWGTNKVASYKMPTVIKVLDAMPRNAMGKVNKKELVKIVFPKELKKTL